MSDGLRRAKALVVSALLTRVYRAYRARRIASIVRGFTPRRITRCYGGFMLEIELPDPLARGWYDHDWPPLPELELLRQHGLRPGARVFDIGAHQGVVALMCARIVGPAGEVVAVEAERHNARAAERNRVLNAAENVVVIHAAGSAHEGSVMFTEGLSGRIDRDGGTWGKVEVPALTVDGLARRYGAPDVVLIDVEGAEEDVLEGASDTLASGSAAFFVEVHVGVGLDVPAERLLRRFDDGYRVLVAPDSEGHADHRFVDVERALEVLHDRFFLIAIPVRDGPVQSR